MMLPMSENLNIVAEGYPQRVKGLMLSHAFRFVDQVIFLVDFDNLRSQYALKKIGACLSNDRYNDCGVLHRCYSICKVDYSLLD